MQHVDESQLGIGTLVALDYWTTSSQMYHTELQNFICIKILSSLVKQTLMAFLMYVRARACMFCGTQGLFPSTPIQFLDYKL